MAVYPQTTQASRHLQKRIRFMITRFRSLAALASKLAATIGLVALVVTSAHAQEKNFPAQHQWAWNNDFNGSHVNASFGNDAWPTESFSYNFSNSSLYAYPACCLGWHYGYNPQNDYSQLPRQLSQMHGAPCNFSYSSYGSNMAGDFAYDMFLRFDNKTSSPQLEVMVWGGNNSYPIGTRTAQNVLSAGGITFDLWEGNNNAAGYYVYTFCPHNTGGGASLPTGGSVNVDQKVFFNWLANNRGGSHFNNSMYLDVIEAGLEVVRGNGGAWIGANMSIN
jgi:hypothetical protein